MKFIKEYPESGQQNSENVSRMWFSVYTLVDARYTNYYYAILLLCILHVRTKVHKQTKRKT